MKKIVFVMSIFVMSFSFSFSQNKDGMYFLKSLNDFRKENGLLPVSFSPILDSACKFHTLWMIEKNELTHYEYSNNSNGEYYRSSNGRVQKYDPLGCFPPTYYDTTYKDKDGWITSISRSNNLENCGYYFVMRSYFNKNTVLEMDSLTRIMFINWVNSEGHKKTLLMKKATHVGYYVGYKFVPEKFSFYVYATCILSRKEK